MSGKKFFFTHLSLMLLFLACINGYAITHAGNVNIRVTGSVYIPACNINNGQAVEVDFGEISPTIPSSMKKIVKTINLSCPYYEGKPYVFVSGNTVEYDGNKLLASSMNGLAIALYQGDSDTRLEFGDGISNGQSFIGYEVKSGISVVNTENSSFTFSAKPVVYNDKALSPGEFSASASMSINYF